MKENLAERSRRPILKIVAVAIAGLSVAACSRSEVVRHPRPTYTATEADAPVYTQFPETIWGPKVVDYLDNAVVDCAEARIVSERTRDIDDMQYYATRPWYISSHGDTSSTYQRGGFIGNGDLEEGDTGTKTIEGWYIHRGINAEMAIYSSTGITRTIEEYPGSNEIQFKLLEVIDLKSEEIAFGLELKKQGIIVDFFKSEELPHFYDGTSGKMSYYEPGYPQSLSGEAAGPGIMVDLRCQEKMKSGKINTEPQKPREIV